MFAVNDLKKPKADGEGKTNRAPCTYIYSTKSEILVVVVALVAADVVVVVAGANCK